MMNIKSYSELSQYKTFEERFNYLKLNGAVGQDTFGYDRYLNQMFYRSARWKHVRDLVIVRDSGCDLGIEGYEIRGKILIHHMNPITISDIEYETDLLLDPEYLIVVSHDTHNAIHFGDENQIPHQLIERSPNDTKLW